MMRLTRSRPKWSVPRTYRHSPASTQAGGSRRSSKRSRTGLCGAIDGDNSAVTTSPSRISQLHTTRGGTRLLIANTRVEDRVQQIDDEINDHEKYRRDEHRRLNHWVVAVIYPLNGQAADAGP